MDSEKLWSTTEMNKFLYQQLKGLCEQNGFVLSPRKSKHLVRIGAHHIQIVNPRSSYSLFTDFHMQVSPAASFKNHGFFYSYITPRKSNEKKEFLNGYWCLANEDPSSSKLFYDIQKMKEIWGEVIEPQVKQEIISYFDLLDFEQYVFLSENQEDGTLKRCDGPADLPQWFLAMGYNEIWRGNYSNSIPLLEKVVLDYGQHEQHLLPWEREDYNSASTLLLILKRQSTNTAAEVLDKMRELERIALNKVWGVGLSPEGKTIRLKKES